MNIVTRSLQTAVGLTAALTLTATVAWAEELELAVSGFDPVLLSQGMEVKGKASVQSTQGRYRYLFADTENQRKFEAAPGKYGIQFDGACMKMGPLSGRGSADRWVVSDGHIYLFASESCRNNFKSDPAAYTDQADAPPTGNTVSKQRGRELIALALTGMGGADKVDALKNVRWETITVYEQGGQKTEMRQAATLVMPDQYRLDYSYGDFREGHELADGKLVEVSAKNEVTPLSPELYDFVRRRLYREPLALLRARNEAGFVAIAAGTGEVNDQRVEWVNIGYAGATTKLGIDPKSGRILAEVYRGRAPSRMGEICKTYSNFKTLEDGLVLPQQWDVTYDGIPTGGSKSTRSLSVNVPIAAR